MAMRDDEFVEVHGVKFHVPPALAASKGTPRRRVWSEEHARRVQAVVALLKEAYPDARCTLNWATPLELLVATILAAHCSDERVNDVTAGLFRKYHTATDYADATRDELERDIYSIGLQRAKATRIRGAAATLIRDFGGSVPNTMEQLLRLPGVGRKTANMVLSAAFGRQEGIIVDTHVRRVSERLGLVTVRAARRGWAERDLIELVPRGDWSFFGYAVIEHGRQVCTARDPGCSRCPLAQLCTVGRGRE